MKTKIALIGIICFTAMACEGPPQDLTDEQAMGTILEIHKIYEKAVPEKNLNVIMPLYEDEAIYLPFQHVILKGKEQISKAWERTFTYPVVSFDLEIVSVTTNGDLIFEVGRTHSIFDFDGNQVPGEFKYLNVWRRQPNGEYKIYMATYNQWLEPSETE